VSGARPGSTASEVSEIIVVLCAVPMDFDAESLATDLVERSLAACAQVVPGVTSIYRWEGVVERSSERLLLIKTRRSMFGSVEAAIRTRHPYDVPEIVALPVSEGYEPYLAWVNATTG
jgi:periplasmic divalent cation tolerance protein